MVIKLYKNDTYFKKNKFINIFIQELNNIKNISDLELLRIKYLGKKGLISNKIKTIKTLYYLERKSFALNLNNLKKYIFNMINDKRIYLNDLLIKKKISTENIDTSLPGRRSSIGSIHPIVSTMYYIEKFFSKLGFDIVKEGFEIEDKYYNFDALNIPIYHPARDVKDSFWFDSKRLLRTQTSNMQIRIIENNKLPIKIIVPGKVFRRDFDSTHSPIFHQVEGLVIDKNINFSHLKWIINNFLHHFFKKNTKIRFRSSYFPFTVLSCEVDILSHNNSWLEILGCGMVHPSILKRFNINTKIYSGFAFGIGIERITMLYYGVQDLRFFLKNDLKFLKQFKRNRYY